MALCPQGAITLMKKESEKVPPEDKTTVNMRTLERLIGGLNMLKVRMKMLLGMKV